MSSPSDWAIFDRCGQEVDAWVEHKRHLRVREPPDPKPRHPVADEPPRTLGDGPPTPGWPDDEEDEDPEDSGRFGPN